MYENKIFLPPSLSSSKQASKQARILQARFVSLPQGSAYLPYPLPLPSLNPTQPYLTLPYLTLPYPTLPHLTLPYLTLPYPTLPYLTLPYHTHLFYNIHTTSKAPSNPIQPNPNRSNLIKPVYSPPPLCASLIPQTHIPLYKKRYKKSGRKVPSSADNHLPCPEFACVGVEGEGRYQCRGVGERVGE